MNNMYVRNLLIALVVCAIPCTSFGQKLPNLIPYTQDNKWGYADSTFHLVIEPVYDYVSELKNGYACLKKDGLFDIIDSTGVIITQNKYTGVGINGNNYIGVKKNNTWIIFDLKRRKEIIPKNSYQNWSITFIGGLARVVRDNHYGFMDTTGNEVIPCIYDSCSYKFCEGYVAVRTVKKWGYMDNKGNIKIPCIYDAVEGFREGRAAVGIRKKGWGFIDTAGNVVIPLEYEEASSFYEGFAYFVQNDKIGFFDKQGKILIPPLYDYCNYFQNGFAYVGTRHIAKLINLKGKTIFKGRGYDDIDYFNEGMADISTSRSCKDGFIDTTGKIVIKPKYDYGGEFHWGLGDVEKNNKSGFINKKGEVVIPLIYEDVLYFEHGIAEVKRNGKSFYIDTKGREYIKW